MLKVVKKFDFAYRGIDVVHHEAGAQLADDDACAAVALKEGWVKREKGKPAAAEKGAKPESEAALNAAIAGAIPGLNPLEDMTRNGVPSTAALERDLGYPVSAAERDKGMDAYVAGLPKD